MLHIVLLRGVKTHLGLQDTFDMGKLYAILNLSVVPSSEVFRLVSQNCMYTYVHIVPVSKRLLLAFDSLPLNDGTRTYVLEQMHVYKEEYKEIG